MRWRGLILSLFLLGTIWGGPLATVASACPMCKEANETDDRRPRAYMYSILFMMSMPAVMVTGFGFTFYRLSKRPHPLDDDLEDHVNDRGENP